MTDIWYVSKVSITRTNCTKKTVIRILFERSPSFGLPLCLQLVAIHIDFPWTSIFNIHQSNPKCWYDICHIWSLDGAVKRPTFVQSIQCILGSFLSQKTSTHHWRNANKLKWPKKTIWLRWWRTQGGSSSGLSRLPIWQTWWRIFQSTQPFKKEQRLGLHFAKAFHFFLQVHPGPDNGVETSELVRTQLPLSAGRLNKHTANELECSPRSQTYWLKIRPNKPTKRTRCFCMLLEQKSSRICF